MAAKFEISKDHAGKFRFHLKAPNGEIIAASQGYETKANAENGIQEIKKAVSVVRAGRRTQSRSGGNASWRASVVVSLVVNGA
jgi:uncharacterized protein